MLQLRGWRRAWLDPFLIGYFVDNELAWGSGNDPRSRYTLALNTLRLGTDSPAKLAFVRLLVDNYHSASAFASAWGITVASWDTLRQDGLILSDSILTRPAVTTDLSRFSALYAEAYYRSVARNTPLDPNHLLRSRFRREPGSRPARAIVALSASISTIVRFRGMLDDLGMPAIFGEFQFGTADRGLFWPGCFNVASEYQRGPAYAQYLGSAFANHDIVGSHWFQYVDEPLTGRLLDGENGHISFVSVDDVPYDGFVTRVRKANLSSHFYPTENSSTGQLDQLEPG
jgi:hypothetical protein